jgi:hypothetical protein
LLYQQKTKTNSFLLQYASAIHPHQENFKTKTKRKEIAKMPKDAISHKPFNTLYSVQFYSTKLKQSSQGL